MNVDHDYLNSLSVEQLRRELVEALEVKFGLLYALRDAPELPSPFVLLHLGTVGKWPEDFNLGKELQFQHGSAAIPYKTECEVGAGLWSRIRRGLTSEEPTG